MREFMKEKYGGIDVLVNNAGIAFKNAATEPFGVQASVTVKTNYWSNRRTCEILFPILKPGARVVNMSSSAGFLKNIKGESLRARLAAEDLTVEELDEMMTDFVKTANEGTHGDHGWPTEPRVTYIVSKVGWSALSRIQQRQL